MCFLFVRYSHDTIRDNDFVDDVDSNADYDARGDANVDDDGDFSPAECDATPHTQTHIPLLTNHQQPTSLAVRRQHYYWQLLLGFDMLICTCVVCVSMRSKRFALSATLPDIIEADDCASGGEPARTHMRDIYALQHTI